MAHTSSLVAGRPPLTRGRPARPYSSKSTTGAAPTPKKTPATPDADPETPASAKEEKEKAAGEYGEPTNRDPPQEQSLSSSSSSGAMSRRLAEATEDALLTGGRAGRRAVEDAGFSEELKARLLAKVQDAQFRSDNAAAFAEAGLAGGDGRGAGARTPHAPGPAWTGEEPTEDAVRRMLQDAHKPLRVGGSGGGKPRLPDLQPIDLRLTPSPRGSPGERAATAREKAGAYTNERAGAPVAVPNGRSEEERAAFRREVQERFGPAGRTMPATLTGLASLANERIEDAIARGQFRNIPRGAGVQRDARADNPFVDTTEYIMNKMIQRQDLVPPWIEKQQELLKAARVFRTRLRADWRRHVARMIAAEGGSLDHQLRRARRLARAEALLHPPPSPAAAAKPAAPVGDDAVGGLAEAERRVVSEWATEEEVETDPRPTTTTTETRSSSATTDATTTTTGSPSQRKEEEEIVAEQKEEEEEDDDEATILPRPYRDADWLAAERAYMEAAVRHLNTLTRSYNLMAPELAKKPYFSLERELARCYADVAPHVAAAIRDRAAAPVRSSLAGDYDATKRRPGILDRFGGRERDGAAKVYDSRAPHYGFREMWRDLFGGGKTG